MGLPNKDKLVGNPTIGDYKTALGDFYDYVKGLHFWKPSITVVVGDVVFKPNSTSSVYAKCTTAGITGTAEPIWPTVGNTITDGNVTWEMHEITIANVAAKLQTPRKINGVNFDGSADITTELAGRVGMFTGTFGGSDGKRPIDIKTLVPNEGWVICDGTNGTPDLRGKFVLGTSASHALNSTGGEENHTLTITEMPSHSHDMYALTQGTDLNAGAGGDNYWTTRSTSSTGGNLAHNNMPPFYALCFIMKA